MKKTGQNALATMKSAKGSKTPKQPSGSGGKANTSAKMATKGISAKCGK